MRHLVREEIQNLNYTSEKTPEPPDTIFEIAVPQIHDDFILDKIAKDIDSTDDQR
jgi:hypothetical protein